MKRTLGFTLCLILIGLESLIVFSQVGADKRPAPPPPKPTTTTKTPAKKPTRSSSSKSRPTPTKSSTSESTEPEFWETIRNSSDVQDFKDYLQAYPNGAHAAIARTKIRQLEAAPTTGAINPSEMRTRNPSTANLSLSKTRTNQAGIEFVLIPPGSFTMGSTNGEADEKPVHQVTINYSFYMGRYEVTQTQWQAVMGSNPSSVKGDNLPMETVSWLDAQHFLQKLNQMNDGYIYRLPTEAEWEYAARAGTTTNYYWGDDVTQACRFANVADQTFKTKNPDWGIVECRDGYAETSPVGSFTPNGWGLFDVTGNVWEWCEDWYHPSYDGAPTNGSAWLSEMAYRVLRGGPWNADADYLRSAKRNRNTPDNRFYNIGFRVVAVARTQ